MSSIGVDTFKNLDALRCLEWAVLLVLVCFLPLRGKDAKKTLTKSIIVLAHCLF